MNKWLGLGRLTKDPELRSIGETSVARTSIAVGRRFKNKDGNYDADFINVSAFGAQAEFLTKYFKKGDMISVVGRITTGSYEKDGQRIFTTEVTIEEIGFVGGKNAAGDTTSRQPDNGFMSIPDGNTEELPFN